MSSKKRPELSRPDYKTNAYSWAIPEFGASDDMRGKICDSTRWASRNSAHKAAFKQAEIKMRNARAIVSALRTRYFRWSYQQQVKKVRNTAPILPGSVEATILSMLHPRDLLPYLVALKSLHRVLPASQHVLVADPALREEHLSFLRQHVPKLEVVRAEAFRHAHLPQGGTWERLAAICHYRKEAFVVQLDADTLTLTDLPEVSSAIMHERPFLLSEKDNLQIGSIQEAEANARTVLKSEDGVQWHCESRLTTLECLGVSRYMRGCSGFSGFSRSTDALELLVEISKVMQEQLGERWVRWGTEQFASNVLVCHGTNAVPLPHPKYCSPNAVTGDTVFVHFIGYLRFISGLYAAETERILSTMTSEGKEMARGQH